MLAIIDRPKSTTETAIFPALPPWKITMCCWLITANNVDTIVCVGTPGSPEEGAQWITDPTKSSGNYSQGDAVVYKCTGIDGYGVIARICQNNGNFTAPDRTCKGGYMQIHL